MTISSTEKGDYSGDLLESYQASESQYAVVSFRKGLFQINEMQSVAMGFFAKFRCKYLFAMYFVLNIHVNKSFVAILKFFILLHPVHIFVLIVLSNLESTKIFVVNYFLTNGFTFNSTEKGDYWRDLLGSYQAIESHIVCFRKKFFSN